MDLHEDVEYLPQYLGHVVSESLGNLEFSPHLLEHFPLLFPRLLLPLVFMINLLSTFGLESNLPRLLVLGQLVLDVGCERLDVHIFGEIE